MDRTFIPVDNVGRRWHNNHVCSSSTTRLAGCDELRETVDTIKTGRSDNFVSTPVQFGSCMCPLILP